MMVHVVSFIAIVLFQVNGWLEDTELPDFLNSNQLKYITFSLMMSGLIVVIGIYFVSFPATISHAKMSKMSNEELSQVTGKNLLDFTIEEGQTDVSGSFGNNYHYRVRNTHITFARINLDARFEVDVGGNEDGIVIDDLKLGHYYDGFRIGDGEDGFITGTGNGSDGQSFYYGPHFNGYNGCNGCGNNDQSTSWDFNSTGITLAPGDKSFDAPEIRGAYVELAYENFGDESSKEIAGVRVGAEKIRGGATIDSINQISTSIRAQDFNDLGAANCSGHRMNDCPTGPGGFLSALSLFNALTFGGNGSDWGDGDGWTEDLWISFNAQDMFWRHNNPEAGTNNASEARFHTDGEGFWLHATDDVEGGLS